MKAVVQVKRVRRAVAAAAALTALLTVAACSSGGSTGSTASSQGSGVTKVTVAEEFTSTLNSALYLAQKEGFFAKQGLDVNFVAVPNGNTLASLLGGSAQLAVESGVFPVTALAQDQKFTVFAATGNGFSEGVIVNSSSYAKSGLTASSTFDQRIRALAGKPLGVLTPTGENTTVFKYLFHLAGVPLSELKTVSLGTPTAIVSALKAGTIFAAAIGAPYPQIAESAGYAKLLYNLSAGDVKQMTDTLTLGMVATPSYYASNPSVIKRFTTALQQGQDYVYAHPAASADYIASTYFAGSPKSAVVAALDDQLKGGAIAHSTTISPESVQRLITFMGATGQKVGSDWKSIFPDLSKS